MNKHIRMLSTFIMASVILFAGCGAKSAPSEAAVAPAASAAMVSNDTGFAGTAEMMEQSKEAPTADTAATAAPALKDRKIIKHGNLSLETKEFDTAIPKIIDAVTSAGGYIESQSLDGQSLSYQGSYYERYARISARIPADKLGEVTASVGKLCNIVSQGENMDDITDSYFDTKAHLDTLTIQEERLLEILKKAEKLEDVITLEKALSDVRYQIESLTAAMKRMDSQIAYSYLNIDLREVSQYNEAIATPKTFGDKLAISFSRAGDHLINSVQGVTLFVVEAAPITLLWLAVIGCIAMLVRSALCRAKRCRTSKVGQLSKKPESKAADPEEKT
ncbi:DUF4349 domain-containing protein [Oscillospiraceae bacterium PP1C4]